MTEPKELFINNWSEREDDRNGVLCVFATVRDRDGYDVGEVYEEFPIGTDARQIEEALMVLAYARIDKQ